MAIAGAATVWAHASHGAASTNVDYSNKTQELSISFDGEEVDATCFNAAAFRAYEQSFKNGEIEVTYKYDAAIGTVITDLWKNGTSVTFSLSPLGTAGSSPRVTGSMICRTISLPFSVGELQQIEATFRITGTPTFDTH
jgi:RNA 3'-terminal phosphate cyclase